MTGGDGGFGDHRSARKTARKSRARVSFDAPERGEKEREFEGRGGRFTVSESMTSGGGTWELRRGISAAWRPESRRGREEKGEEGEGLYRRGLDGLLLADSRGERTPASVTGNRERGDCGGVMTGGACMAVREGRG
jgi:hypothetical protein